MEFRISELIQCIVDTLLGWDAILVLFITDMRVIHVVAV